MPIKIECPDSDLPGFSEEAKRKLQEIVMTQAKDLISECQRLDSVESDGKATPDINRAIVEKASVIKKNNLIRRKRNWHEFLPSIISSASAIFVGAFYKDPFPNNDQVIKFSVTLAIFTLSTTLQYVLGGKNE